MRKRVEQNKLLMAVAVAIVVSAAVIFAIAKHYWSEDAKPVYEEPMPQWTNLGDLEREMIMRKLEESK